MNYETLYPLNTECVYPTQHLPFFDLFEKKYKTETQLVLNDDIKQKSKNELIEIYKQVVSTEKLYQDLLTYEFINVFPNFYVSNISEIKHLLLNELDRYQWTVGGFAIEDIEWTECNETLRFVQTPNQTILYNTIGPNNRKDLDWFITTLVNRITSNVDNKIFKITHNIVDDTPNEITWLTITIEKIDNEL